MNHANRLLAFLLALAVITAAGCTAPGTRNGAGANGNAGNANSSTSSNANTGTAFNQVFDPQTNGASWFRPTTVLGARFVRFNITVDY